MTRRTRKITHYGNFLGIVDIYYNSNWKSVEERRNTDTCAERQHIYGIRGRNDLICRDRYYGTSHKERHYALNDAMGSVTAITNTAGTVVERYNYCPRSTHALRSGISSSINAPKKPAQAQQSAFGQSQVMDKDFAPRSQTQYDWQTRFHGEQRDPETGFYNYGYRYYDPITGRWPSRDPIAERGGFNLYGFAYNDVINSFDAFGLKVAWYSTKIVSKSFINGLPRINRGGGHPNPRLLSAAAVAFLAADFGGVKPFQQNPLTDAKDQTYRLFSQIDAKFCCDGNRLLGLSSTTDKDGGLEGAVPVPTGKVELVPYPPFVIPEMKLVPFYGTMNLNSRVVRTSLSSAEISWKGWGKPHPILAEPTMQAIGGRTSTNIWHKGKVTVYCSNGIGYHRLDAFSGSRFPSHKIWINGKLKRHIRQQFLSDLWVPQPGNPTFVR